MFVGLAIELYNCLAWFLLSLLLGFSLPSCFCCYLDSVRVLGVPFGFSSFLFVGHFRWRCLPHKGIFEVGECSGCFWYPFLMFHLEAFLFVVFLPPFQVFALAPRPKLFKVPLGFLNASVDLFLHFLLERLVSFPLGYHVGNLSWELGSVAPIINLRFLVNFCLFLLEAIGENNLGSFFLKAHLKHWIHSFIALMVGRRWCHMMLYGMPLLPLQTM